MAKSNQVMVVAATFCDAIPIGAASEPNAYLNVNKPMSGGIKVVLHLDDDGRFLRVHTGEFVQLIPLSSVRSLTVKPL